MDPYDHLFSDNLAQDENAGEIASDDDGSGDGGDGHDDDTGASAKQIKLEPKKKTVLNPRNTLNAAKLCGPRGIIALGEHFKDFKFRGKGHEAADLDNMMRRYEHWAHRLFPKYHFDDCLATVEKLGNKKVVQAYMNKYRTGLLQQEIEDAAANRSDDSVADDPVADDDNRLNQPVDPLDSMLDEQIAISRGRTSLANTSGVANLSMDTTFDTIRQESSHRNETTSHTAHVNPLQDAQQVIKSPTMNDEIRAKIEANRIKAMEIRKARQLALSQSVTVTENATENAENDGS